MADCYDSFKTYIVSIIEAGLAVGGAPEPLWTPALRIEFSSRLKSAFVTINLAIARSVAITLIRGSTIVARYARTARGPHRAAPAAQAGGYGG